MSDAVTRVADSAAATHAQIKELNKLINKAKSGEEKRALQLEIERLKAEWWELNKEEFKTTKESQ